MLPIDLFTFQNILQKKSLGDKIHILQEKSLGDKIQSIFCRFKLTAIVLCDPADSDFAEEIKNNFEVLNRITGEDLLCITFINEKIKSEFYKPIILSEEYHKGDRELKEGIHLLTSLPSSKADLESLASRFGLKTYELPAIVITTDLWGNEYRSLITTKEDVYDQLVGLSGEAARRKAPISLNEIDISKFRAHSLLKETYSRIEECHSRIIEELTDVMCSQHIRKNKKDWDALAYMHNAINRIKVLLHDLYDNEDLPLDIIDRLMDEYAYNRLSIPHKQNNDCQYYIDKRMLSGADKNTLNSLNSYNKILSLLYQGEPFDYLYLANGIGRMFETEINLSVVQQMRKTKGIPMPSYFNRFYKTTREFVIPTNKRAVDLNMLDNNYDEYDEVWRAPNLGDSQAAYKWMRERYDNICRLEDEFVFNDWYHIAKDRNNGSHTSVSADESKRRFVDSYQHFKEFLDRKYFVELMDIKKELSGSN